MSEIANTLSVSVLPKITGSLKAFNFALSSIHDNGFLKSIGQGIKGWSQYLMGHSDVKSQHKHLMKQKRRLEVMDKINRIKADAGKRNVIINNNIQNLFDNTKAGYQKFFDIQEKNNQNNVSIGTAL